MTPGLRRVPFAELAAARSTWERFVPDGPGSYPGTAIAASAIRNLGLDVVIDVIERLGADGALSEVTFAACLRERSNAALRRMRRDGAA